MNPKSSITKITEYHEMLPDDHRLSIEPEHLVELLEAEGIIHVHANGRFFSWLKGHIMTKEEFLNLFRSEATNP